MALIFENAEYSPSKLAKVLSEEYGHKVTPSVIRKWHNEIFAGISTRKRNKEEARVYSHKDLMIFNAIAIFRNFGYSIEDIKSILNYTREARSTHLPGKNIVFDKGAETIYAEAKRSIEKRQKGIELFNKFLEEF